MFSFRHTSGVSTLNIKIKKTILSYRMGQKIKLQTLVYFLSSPNIDELLADRTNDRAYATVLRLSIVCTECIVAKRCVL